MGIFLNLRLFFHQNMLVDDCWLESLRFLRRCDLDAVEMLNKRAHSLTLSDKELSIVRRNVDEVSLKTAFTP